LIYFDNASSTKTDDLVTEEMAEFAKNYYAIPSSIFSHTLGIEVADKIEEVRSFIGAYIGSKPNEIIFTASGTESNNLAIKGFAYANKKKGNHLITSTIEHISVLESFKRLKEEGFEITYVPVDSTGKIDLDFLHDAIKDSTILVSIQLANQEVGTLQDISKIADIVKEKGKTLHVDAAIAVPYVKVDLSQTPIDLLTISPHKFYGPKGIGILYKREDVKLAKLIDGGYNEFNLRAGHENTWAIVGIKKAFEVFKDTDVERIKQLKSYLIKRIELDIPDVILNGNRVDSLPHIVNFTFKFIEGESISLRLDFEGIAVTTGSACYSKNLQASHVLLAMGKTHEDAHGSIRFSLSKYNTKEEIDFTVEKLKEIVSDLRRISPLLGGN